MIFEKLKKKKITDKKKEKKNLKTENNGSVAPVKQGLFFRRLNDNFN